MTPQFKTTPKAALAVLEEAFAYYDDEPRKAQVAAVREASYFEYVKPA